MFKSLLIILTILIISNDRLEYKLPINTMNRKYINALALTDIGSFGLLRKERPGIPAHFHTGVDIKRPSNNYFNEPIFPIYEGVVISKREDGPYAQLIIEHGHNQMFWTVYEHIAGIEVELFENVNTNTPIARFMNKEELNKYGWQFDHFHLEILKKQPIRLKESGLNPERLFASYTLHCYTLKDLNEYFYEPISYLKDNL
jgi:hypothetical protein